MDADGRDDALPRGREPGCCLRVGERRPGHEKAPDPGGPRPGDLPVRVRRHVQVAVGVGEDHLTMLPLGTSEGTSSSTGFPSSPTDAARTIPFDSTPMSFAGFRFATTTMLRPTSAPGSYCAAMPATICRRSPPT